MYRHHGFGGHYHQASIHPHEEERGSLSLIRRSSPPTALELTSKMVYLAQLSVHQDKYHFNDLLAFSLAPSHSTTSARLGVRRSTSAVVLEQRGRRSADRAYPRCRSRDSSIILDFALSPERLPQSPCPGNHERWKTFRPTGYSDSVPVFLLHLNLC
ncbi:hypothetical protein PUNSTDRAFT_52551 [Punctularia strigosozonata HHB-11173 SS5]|uniref:uncharacterized protein n=1 Tax=Punctularia strigosozonata (strain HHB-11173) TaxID=741275 RepID=UPI0004416A08|nr:uncharacterized protein PUNSTDRAFT_52551 [Punctularia strigosozonata HHB-11173 SS5]EIN09214.1 hypothetical protein PUNSTDRAFT_52551 [Punctularia strigosozonata HHB-11173 SS5]